MELDRRGERWSRDANWGGYLLQVRGKTVSRHRLLPAARKAAKARALRDHRIVVVLRVSEDGKRTKPVYTFGVDGKQRNLVYRHGASHRE